MTQTVSKKKPQRVGERFKRAVFGGCVICNRTRRRSADLCDACFDTLASFDTDPRYPENNPEALWQALHGQKDIWQQTLGPGEWPYPQHLIDFVESTIVGAMGHAQMPERGALISRSIPASIRLAGAFVLRRLADAGKLEAFDGGDGFYFRIPRGGT